MDLYQKLYKSMLEKYPEKKKQIVQSETNEMWKNLKTKTQTTTELTQLVTDIIKKNNEKNRLKKNNLFKFWNQATSKSNNDTGTRVYCIKP